MAILISADDIKKKLPDYSPEKAEQYHRESARLADREFENKLKVAGFREVILMSGGAASGKTEFLATHLVNRKNCLILDATLSTEEGAGIKLKKIIKAKKDPIIYAVIPDGLKRAFVAFLHRDRKFSDAHFYKTHSGSRRTLLWIAKNYPDVEMNIVESSYIKGRRLQFSGLKFDSRRLLVSYLSGLQVTEAGIIEQLI
ncbi:MAG: hypothetical protein G01um101416_1199 [Microgenomates group bacterium Gr01-1014_16]|nr:MAG: hypothetical protein G01um101416_1199 [Microgenomates group bacterium Gr01-1014_16]